MAIRRLGQKIRTKVLALEEVRLSLQGVLLDLRETERRLDLLETGTLGGGVSGGIASIPTALDVQFQAFMRSGTGRIHGRLYDVTAGAPVAGSEISTVSTTLGVVTSRTVTLTIGREYRAQFGQIGGENGEVVGAHLVAA